MNLVPSPHYALIARTASGGVLCQGDMDAARHAYRLQFDMLILTAEEFQPAAADIGGPGMDVHHAPNDDSGRPFYSYQAKIAEVAADKAAEAVSQGKRVLVTCAMGRNRSGLVSALALHKLTGWAGSLCASIVKGKRKGALTNPAFVNYLTDKEPIPKSA